MAGVKVGEKFYFLDAEREKWVFSTEDEAVAKLRDVAKDVNDPDEVKIFEVDASGEKWSIRQVSWARIAMKLIKEE